MAISTIKFSAFADGGDLAENDVVVGLRSGANTRFLVDDIVNIIWGAASSTPVQMLANHGYIVSNASTTSLALPTTSVFGDELFVVGQGAAGWIITQIASQLIHVGSIVSTTGVSGSVASTNRYDSIHLVCLTANTEWTCVGAPQGMIDIL